MRALLLLLLVVAPAALATPLPVKATPPQVVLGRDNEVLLEVQVAPDSGPVRATASSGTLTAVKQAGPVRTFRWEPPDIRYPQLALVALWQDPPEGPPEVALLRLPLLGRPTLPVATEPGATVVVEIEGTRFGPVSANRRGTTQVPVEVPPGVNTARILVTARGRQTDRTIELEVPTSRPLVAVLSPERVPASGGWLHVLGEGSQQPPELKAQGATVSPLEATPGLYRVLPEQGATTLTVQVRWQEDTSATSVSAEVAAKPPPVVLPPPVEEPVVARAPQLSAHALLGGFYAGGANAGPLLALGGGLHLPSWPWGLTLEVELGLRSAWLDAEVVPSGRIGSRVVAVPVVAGARAVLLERGPFTLHGRAGVGVMPFEHQVTLASLPPLSERQFGLMGFVAAQADWKLGPLSALLELRLGYAEAGTPRLQAQLGGVSTSFGVRYSP